MWKVLSAALSGLLVSLSFDRNIWWLTILGLALLLFLVDKKSRRSRLKIFFAFSLVLYLLQLNWLRVIGTDAWILVTIICIIPWLFVGLIKFSKKSISSLTLICAAVAVSELVRSHIPFGGFPWSLIAYSQIDGPLVNLARIGSTSLVTFSAVFVSGLLLGLLSRRFLSRLVVLLILLVLVENINPIVSSQTQHLVAIQGNVPRVGLDQSAQRKAVLNNHISLTREYFAKSTTVSQPDLVIWPESSTDIDPLTNREVAGQISQLVNQIDVSILVGATTKGVNPDGLRNMGILWTTTGPADFYVKNNLVPFGEYVPFRAILSEYIDRIALVPRDYVPGTELGLFSVNNVVFGDVICFEIAFGDYVRQVVNAGSAYLTVQTNNATYGNTKQPEQQFKISRFRAIEHQRSVIVASTSGISGAIDPNGEVLAKTEQFTPAVVDVKLPLETSSSFSDRYPRWFSLICVAIVFIGILRNKSWLKSRKKIS